LARSDRASFQDRLDAAVTYVSGIYGEWRVGQLIGRLDLRIVEAAP
jgi:hypothetical protein